MALTGDIAEFRKAANFVMVRNRLRPASKGGIFWGILTILAAVLGKGTVTDLLLGLLGAFLLVKGIWSLARPSAVGVAINGVVIAALGAINLGVMIAKHLSPSWLVLSVLQVHYAYQNFRDYGLFKRWAGQKPREDYVEVMKRLLADIRNSRAADGEYVVEFVAQRQLWRGWVMENAAVFVSVKGWGVRVAARDQVGFRRAADARKVTVRVGDLSANATMKPEMLRRAEAWQSQPAAAAPV